MVYIHPVLRLPINAEDQSTEQLYGLMKYLCYHHGSKYWVEVNGEAKLLELCSVVRRRFQVEGKFFGLIASIVNRLDPPRCRCGKKGTRIIGASTFCLSCGPTSEMRSRKAWSFQQHELRGADIETTQNAIDKNLRQSERFKQMFRSRDGKP